MPASLLFHPELVDFIHRGLSISAASRDARLIPSISKALACRVIADSKQLRLMLDERQASKVLLDIRHCQRIAVTCCLPSSHRTIQIKGGLARQESLAEGDLEYTQNYVQRLSQDLDALGYPMAMIAKYFRVEPAHLTVISFVPEAVFEQSPGEKAGLPMELQS